MSRRRAAPSPTGAEGPPRRNPFDRAGVSDRLIRGARSDFAIRMDAGYLVLISEEDPVASRVAERWGTPESTGLTVDGAPIRRLSEDALLLRRPGRHIHDERVDLRLPTELRTLGLTLVWPSIHRSEQNIECLTVHPLGNPGPTAEVGGRPRTLVPTDPRRMTACLRALAERGRESSLAATFEATHHGPEVALPAFFVEIGYGGAAGPPDAAVRILADEIPKLRPDPRDRVALGVGGGHYVPHFTDLAGRRRWAFGHLLSRHALVTLDAPTALAAWQTTVGADGILFARTEDALRSEFQSLGPRLREADAPRRSAESAPTSASPTASGT
jgi:D-aminoacyl-tRNA deacylase